MADDPADRAKALFRDTPAARALRSPFVTSSVGAAQPLTREMLERNLARTMSQGRSPGTMVLSPREHHWYALMTREYAEKRKMASGWRAMTIGLGRVADMETWVRRRWIKQVERRKLAIRSAVTEYKESMS